MGLFTKDDVSRAADVFLNWFDRFAGSTNNKYDDDVLAILQGQKDSFVSLLTKVFHLDSTIVEATKRQMFAAPVQDGQVDRLCPGISNEEGFADLTNDQKQAIIAIAKTVHK